MDLRRDYLLDRIRLAADAKLILIHAPAGYGKSTLLRQLADEAIQSGCRVGWITPMSQDADPSRFVQLFVATCERLLDEGDHDSAIPRDVSSLLETLRGPILFLVDEYDQFASKQVDAMLHQIVDELPAGMRIAVASRILPAMPNAKLKLEGLAIVLGSIDLRFDLDEAQRFLQENAGFGHDQAGQLHNRVDGWPAAFQFFNLALHVRNGDREQALARVMSHDLVDYLAQEVFALQSEETQQALLLACLADRICDPLLATLIGGDPDEARLETLSAAGLFLDPIDGDRHWFRFHPLFGDFLRQRLGTITDKQTIFARHEQIADWLVAHQLDEMAIEHLLLAGKQGRAADLLERVSDRLVRDERLGLLVSLVERLEPELFYEHSNLVTNAVIAYGFRRAFARAHQLLDWSEANSADATLLARAERDVQRCFVLAAEDRVPEMGERAQAASNALGDDSPFFAAVALNAHAFCLAAQSQFTEATDMILRARPLHDRAKNYFGRGYADSILATIKMAVGEVDEAVGLLTRSVSELDHEAPAGILAGAVVAAHLGDAFYEQNRLADAERVISSHLALIKEQCIVDPLCLGVVALARIASLSNRPATAHELFEHLIESGHAFGLVRLVMCGRAELVREATLSGDIETAERRFRAMGQEARLPTDTQLMLASSEIESQRVTHARLLVHSGRYAEARGILQAEIRTAKSQRRMRRTVRLKALLALCLDLEGQHAYARRVMIRALTLGAPGGMVRIFLDEGPGVVRILKAIASESCAPSTHWTDDPVADYVRRLVGAAEGKTPQAEVARLSDEAGDEPEFENLTSREADILSFLAKGHSNSELAARLAVSQNTIKFHLRNVYAKLDVSSRVQAIQAARHFKLID